MTRILSSLFVVGLLASLSGCVITEDKATTYEPCYSDSECPAADACLEFTVGGVSDSVCSRDCIDDNDCPGANGYAGACYGFGGRHVCAARCDDDFDCYAGFACTQARIEGTTLSDMICLPY